MFVVFWYSKRKMISLVILVPVLLIMITSYQDVIKDMLDTGGISNSIKLSDLDDYFRLFADRKTLLLGQGLGSYFNTATRGYVSITELTYFEFIRRFGLILSLASFILLLYPLARLRLKPYHSVHYIFICYAIYLMACFLQPLLMSSTGMILMSLVLYKTFTHPSLDNQRQVLMVD